MEPNKKIENVSAQTAKPAQAQGGNKTFFWILGGCLVLLVIGGLVAAGIAYWSYKKMKNESILKDAAIIQQQRQLEAVKIEAQKKQEKAPENVSTNIPEEPAPVADPGVPSDINPPAASEKAIGYLKKVYSKGGKDYINIDYVQWLSGDTAEQAMREDGQCPKSGECIVYNDYYIRNQNPLIRTFEVVPDVEIRAHDFEKDYASGDWTESMTFSRFSQYFSRNVNNGYWTSAPFHIEIGNNKVLKITEQYIP